jgi:hypothetical protein
MEAIIQVVEGKELKASKCKFCDDRATEVFGVVNLEDKRYNGFPMKGFHICKKHLRALNSLLDGTKDIDSLIKNYDRLMAGGHFNLRAHI